MSNRKLGKMTDRACRAIEQKIRLEISYSSTPERRFDATPYPSQLGCQTTTSMTSWPLDYQTMADAWIAEDEVCLD